MFALVLTATDRVLWYCTTTQCFFVWVGNDWEMVNSIKENFIQSATGNTLVFVSSAASGGSLSTEIPENQNWWNGSTPQARLGQSSNRITTGIAARQSISTALNYRLYSSTQYYWEAVLAFTGGQVNFAQDPTLQCWGFLDNFTTAIPNNGFYFRPPRVGETNFLKYVVRVAGAENIADTTIPYDSTARRYVKGAISWDGLNMHFWATDTTNKSLHTIANFLALYPSLGTLNLGFGVLNARNGTATTPVARTINVDSVATKL